MTNEYIKDFYYDFYHSKDKEGKRRLTNEINAILEVVPPKVMAMALVALVNGNKDMMDAKELNEDICEQLAKGDL